MSSSRKSKRNERIAKRREERTQRKSEPAESKRNLWLALGGALVIGVVLVGAFVVFSGQEDTASITASSSGASTSTSSTQSDGRFPISAYQRADLLGGEELDFNTLLGQGTPVVLNFWAGQCPPCRAEMPAFQRVYDDLGDEFLLVGVDIGPFIGLGSNQSAADLLRELRITYPAAYSTDERAMRDHDILSMPTTIFYDGDGNEVGRKIGLLQEDELQARIQDLIGLSA